MDEGLDTKRDGVIMKPTWVRKTYGNPLSAVRQFLSELWPLVGLEGLLAPVYKTGIQGISPELIEDQEHVKFVDPFLPFVPVNSAIVIEKLVEKRPLSRFGVILRSCENRALHQMVMDGRLSIESLVIIGVDCLGSFPIEDYEWRYHKKGTLDRITRECLQFSRQGGIAPYRYRNSCQMCSSPADGDVDLRIGMIGLPTNQLFFVRLENERMAGQINLREICDAPADPLLKNQRSRLLDSMIQRRQNVNARMLKDLDESFPQSLDTLINYLQNCTPCRNCLDACAIFAGMRNSQRDYDLADISLIKHWIASCVSCGMCEQACPRHLPLPAIIKNIRAELMPEIAH